MKNKMTKQRLMEMAGLMTEEEQHLKMPFANSLPQGPKRIEWYGKHLAKMMTPADQEGPEGLLNALLDNPEDFPQNWRVAPEGELDYIESVADDIVAFANDYMDMPGFKGTKNALAGLSIREIEEGLDDNTKVEVTLTTTIGKIKEMIEPDWTLNIDDQSALQAFQKEMEEDLNQWFNNNGGEWMSDGINQDVYADYITYGEDPLDLVYIKRFEGVENSARRLGNITQAMRVAVDKEIKALGR